MPTKPPTHRPPRPTRPADRATASQRGYDSRWQRARAAFIAQHPLCRECEAETPPRITAADVVDHVIPHRGDDRLFWDESNWQPLCAYHHNVKTAREDGGFGRKPKARI